MKSIFIAILLMASFTSAAEVCDKLNPDLHKITQVVHSEAPEAALVENAKKFERDGIIDRLKDDQIAIAVQDTQGEIIDYKIVDAEELEKEGINWKAIGKDAVKGSVLTTGSYVAWFLSAYSFPIAARASLLAGLKIAGGKSIIMIAAAGVGGYGIGLGIRSVDNMLGGYLGKGLGFVGQYTVFPIIYHGTEAAQSGAKKLKDVLKR